MSRTHPPFSRLVVTQDDVHVAMLMHDNRVSVAASQMMDDELERVTGYLSPDRQWTWIDRRRFLVADTP